jgi:hypothetical protein
MSNINVRMARYPACGRVIIDSPGQTVRSGLEADAIIKFSFKVDTFDALAIML